MRITPLALIPITALVAACGGENLKVTDPPSLQVQASGALILGGDVIRITPPVAPEEPTIVETLRLTNVGVGPLEIYGIRALSTPEDVFAVAADPPPSKGSPVVLAPNETWLIDIVYQGGVEQVATSAELVIDTNPDLQGRTQFKAAIVPGVQLAVLQVAPKVADFGPVGPDEVGEVNLRLLNGGSSDLVVKGFTLLGSAGFEIELQGQVYGQAAGLGPDVPAISLDAPLTIPPGEQREVLVTYTATTPEKAEGTLRIFSNDVNEPDGKDVPLLANASGPCITVNPDVIDFGGKRVGVLASIEVEILSCGTAPLTIESGALTADSDEAFGLDPAELPLTLQPNEVATLKVNYLGLEVSEFVDGQPSRDEGTLRLTTNTWASEIDVRVTGFALDDDCPIPVIRVAEGEEVIPQTVLHLDGTQSYGPADMATWSWSVTQPAGAVSAFLPSPSAPSPTFSADVAGTYVFRLDVTDINGEQGCFTAEYVVLVVPDEAIHVELLWSTPGDPDETDEGPEAGADMDLHFVHPFATGYDIDGDGAPDGWFDIPFDNYWFNDEPDWGALGSAPGDNPSLDRDDTNGAGPENINLDEPQEGVTYKVGVHYWNDHGWGPSYPVVRVYIHAQLVLEVEGPEMIHCDLWDVARIHWPSGDVDLVEDASGDPVVVNFCNPLLQP